MIWAISATLSFNALSNHLDRPLSSHSWRLYSMLSIFSELLLPRIFWRLGGLFGIHIPLGRSLLLSRRYENVGYEDTSEGSSTGAGGSGCPMVATLYIGAVDNASSWCGICE